MRKEVKQLQSQSTGYSFPDNEKSFAVSSKGHKLCSEVADVSGQREAGWKLAKVLTVLGNNTLRQRISLFAMWI